MRINKTSDHQRVSQNGVRECCAAPHTVFYKRNAASEIIISRLLWSEVEYGD